MVTRYTSWNHPVNTWIGLSGYLLFKMNQTVAPLECLKFGVT